MTTTGLSVLVVLAVVLAIVSLVYSIYGDRAHPVLYQRLTKSLDDMGKRLTMLSLRMVEMEITLAEYRVGTARLVAQIIQLGHIPAWQPPSHAAALVRGDSVLVQLYALIEDAFKIEEMNNLIFFIGYKPEQIEGDTSEERARALVEFAARRGLLSVLVNRAREMRPLIEWPDASVLTMETY